MVLGPNRPNLEISLKLETPLIIEKRTNGTATNLSRLRKMVPKGSIQFKVNSLQPNTLESIAQIIPNNKPLEGLNNYFL